MRIVHSVGTDSLSSLKPDHQLLRLFLKSSKLFMVTPLLVACMALGFASVWWFLGARCSRAARVASDQLQMSVIGSNMLTPDDMQRVHSLICCVQTPSGR